MFKKKDCRKCGKKMNEKYEFCPHCGSSTGNLNEEDWGMLGKDDSPNDLNNFQNLFGGISGKMINKMFGSAMKMIEKEMQREMQKESRERRDFQPRTNFELFINGKKIAPENIKVSRKPIKKQTKQPKKQIQLNTFNQKESKIFSELPRIEPETNIRRLSNKIIYEIKMPDIRATKDVSIVRLESSIEIKAISKDKAYYKIIPISMPIISYNVSEGNLILELEAKD